MCSTIGVSMGVSLYQIYFVICERFIIDSGMVCVYVCVFVCVWGVLRGREHEKMKMSSQNRPMQIEKYFRVQMMRVK